MNRRTFLEQPGLLPSRRRLSVAVPSSLRVSSTDPNGLTSPIPPITNPRTNDEETTIFREMIRSGMLAGFPGQG
jgi:hypothetical protein